MRRALRQRVIKAVGGEERGDPRAVFEDSRLQDVDYLAGHIARVSLILRVRDLKYSYCRISTECPSRQALLDRDVQ